MYRLLTKIAVLGVALSLGVSAHAKSTPTAEEEDAFLLCSTLSYIGFHGMNHYQDGMTKRKNKALLMDKFATEDKEAQALFEGIIDESLDEIYTLPKGNNKATKEAYATAMATTVLYVCAEEMDLDIDNLDFSGL